MEVKTIKDCKVLIPNKKHQNFTETEEIVTKGTFLSGKPVKVNGLRRGEPFTYRLFLTDNKKFIYLNCIEPMKATEIKLGADSAQTPTMVNLKSNEMFSQDKVIGLVAGGLLGFGYCKYKNCNPKQTTMYVFAGAAIGYAAAYLMNRNNKSITVLASK
jgi:hypothetical protein